MPYVQDLVPSMGVGVRVSPSALWNRESGVSVRTSKTGLATPDST
jgi:hypothetical protein